MDLTAQKRELRLRICAQRRNLAPEQALRAAGAILERLVVSDAWQDAPIIALYASFGGELPTQPIFEAARESGKRVSFPRVCEEDPRLEFAEAERWEGLRPGRFGVLEPPASFAATPLEPGTLVFVPGVAFDVQGHRLGMGKGYYDRSFAAPTRVRLIGLAFEFQMVEAVPCGPNDRGMDAVVTERGWHWIEEMRRR